MKVYVGYVEYGEVDNYSDPLIVTDSKEKIVAWWNEGFHDKNLSVNYREYTEMELV